MTVEIDILSSCPRWDAVLEDAAGLCRRAARAALDEARKGLSDADGRFVEVSIVLADNAEIADLNLRFRRREGATNVLSFPALPSGDGALEPAARPGPPLLLGDVVLAYETIADEANDQDKTLADHVAHLVIHGILHLLGYDHLDDAEAQIMEPLEIRALDALGVADPYAEAKSFVP